MYAGREAGLGRVLGVLTQSTSLQLAYQASIENMVWGGLWGPGISPGIACRM